MFMVPGMDHCGIGTDGPGISDTGIDPLTALEQWVEEGNAPRELLATKMAQWRPDAVAATRLRLSQGGAIQGQRRRVRPGQLRLR